jgi:PAS domain S-box-containing protein
LAQANSRERALLASLSDVLFIADSSGFVEWSSSTVQRPGVQHAACVGASIFDGIHQEDVSRLRATVAEAVAAPGNRFCVPALRSPSDGRMCFFDYNVTWLPDTPGIEGLLVSRNDVTARATPRTFARRDLPVRESEERLRQVIRLSKIGVFDHDHLADQVYLSPELRQIFGYPAEEQVPFSQHQDSASWDLIHPEDRQHVFAAIARAHRGENGGIFDIEHRIVRRDGSMRWIAIRSQTFFEGAGEDRYPVRTIGAVEDITARREAEATLAMFQHSVQRAPDGIFWLNRDGGFDYVNEQACKALGYSREELLNLRLWEVDVVYARELWEKNWEVWERARGESVERIESWHRRKDGSLVPIEAVGQHIWAANGKSLHVGYIRDITERKQAERAVRHSEDRLRQVAHVYDIGVFDHNHLTNEIYWSAELRSYWGIGLDDPVSLDILVDGVHPDDRSRVKAAVERAHDPAGDGRYNVQHRINHPDGSLRWIDTRSQTFFEGLGAARHAVRTVGALVDVTARIAAEEALRESLREKETLLREVHHRVKNNLQIIASLLHFQAKKIRDPADLAAFSEGRDRLRSMILVHEKLYQSRGLTRIDFGSYLRSLAWELQRSQVERAGRRIEVRVEAAALALPIESALPCGMIVCELLTNVFKYAYPEGRRGDAVLRIVVDSYHVHLTVSDSGIGLPAEFDPERSTTFGWQLIHNLTTQLGGMLAISREAGTHVTVSFPYEPRTR